MNYVEYGKENSDVIILLHGGGLSWWNYKEVAERLQTDYHVVLPILDGHAGCDKQFTTIENNALDIIEFVNSKLGGSVLMMGGGFGGCTINLVKDELYDAFVEKAKAEYKTKFGRLPKVYDVVIADGARKLC